MSLSLRRWRSYLRSALVVLLLSIPAAAQQTIASSSVSRDAATNQIVGVSETGMDTKTTSWYQAYVGGNLYRQADNVLLTSAESYAPSGQGIASVTLRTSASPGTTYRLDSYHYILPVSNYWCTTTRFDRYSYYNASPSVGGNYGPSQTFTGYDPGYISGACVLGWLYLGKTTQTFTSPPAINIINPRVTGVLNQTVQNALVGADIALNTNIVPSNLSGGTYSWTLSGPYVLTGGTANSSSVSIRSTNVGTITATVTYAKSGYQTVSSIVTINSVLPTLTSFTAAQGRELIVRPPGCGYQDSFVRYRLGCMTSSPYPDNGMQFTARIKAPDSYISDPAQSGSKYVQIGSSFRKQIRDGSVQCITKRIDQNNLSSSWQLDGRDPYNGDAIDPIPRFSQGNELTMWTLDMPSTALTFILEREFVDALYIDDRFEMYAVYFAGADPASPTFQAVLAKLSWNWGGQAVYRDMPMTNHQIDFTNAPPTNRTFTTASSTTPYTGRIQDTPWSQCPGGPPPSTSLIDGSRRFVRQHYLDFYGHDPDQGGFDYWTSRISSCAFDLACIEARRLAVSLSFFYSSEFASLDPIMGNPPGSPGFDSAIYNPRFVYYCYQGYLDREPDQGGWDFWTDVLNRTGDYQGVVNAFITSYEYRNQRFPRL